jgi:hypothetical protein
MPKLKAPAGASCFAYEGEEYEVKRGRVEVPHKAVASALLHGFSEIADDKGEDKGEGEGEGVQDKVPAASEVAPETVKLPVLDQPPASAAPTGAQGKK